MVNLKIMFPELNHHQLKALKRIISEDIIGAPIDTKTLLKQGRRNEYKTAYWINQKREEMIKRLEKIYE